MSATTPSGRLYSIDARLRPNGRAGLLVSSLAAFQRYQQEEAWTWELQALTRARPVAGNIGVARAFRDIRQAVLTQHRDQGKTREAVLEMRERLRQQIDDENALKHGAGGLLDIEFVAQVGLLLQAATYPAVIESTASDEQLGSLRDCGWLSGDQFSVLNEAYQELSGARLWAELNDVPGDLNAMDLLAKAQSLCNDILR
jgi:glutamate-ammonia-ligase adenylyltransferase